MSILTPHVLENKQLAIYRIKLGANVVIGAQSIILAGVVVGDNAVIAAGAVVPKFTIIGPGETWGGVPAKRIGS
jgi:acetyltransferase-like isoleucine patch superfamily enzyme